MLGVGGGQYRPFWFILITWINVEFLSLLFLLLFSVSYVCMYWVGAGPYKPGSELMVQQTIIGFQSTQDKLCPVKTEIKFNKKNFVYLFDNISLYIARVYEVKKVIGSLQRIYLHQSSYLIFLFFKNSFHTPTAYYEKPTSKRTMTK